MSLVRGTCQEGRPCGKQVGSKLQYCEPYERKMNAFTFQLLAFARRYRRTARGANTAMVIITQVRV
jgi:hypothetical protein